MKRDPRLTKLSWDHHHGLVMALRIERELPDADDDTVGALYADLVSFWSAGLLPHFRVEQECLLARLLHHLPAQDNALRRTQDDHLSMESLVATMRDTTDLSVRREALAQFGAFLRDHIRWEEATLFEVTQQLLTTGEMDALGREIAEQLPNVVAAPPARPDSVSSG